MDLCNLTSKESRGIQPRAPCKSSGDPGEEIFSFSVAKFEEANVRKTKKLAIEKVTLQNVDEPTLDVAVGGLLLTNYVTCLKTCSGPPNEKLGQQR